jgi:hypothetical protein
LTISVGGITRTSTVLRSVLRKAMAALLNVFFERPVIEPAPPDDRRPPPVSSGVDCGFFAEPGIGTGHYEGLLAQREEGRISECNWAFCSAPCSDGRLSLRSRSPGPIPTACNAAAAPLAAAASAVFSRSARVSGASVCPGCDTAAAAASPSPPPATAASSSGGTGVWPEDFAPGAKPAQSWHCERFQSVSIAATRVLHRVAEAIRRPRAFPARSIGNPARLSATRIRRLSELENDKAGA